MYLVISTSLSRDSRSRLLAREAARLLERQPQGVEFVDLQQVALPSCDADSCYSHPDVVQVAEQIRAADAVLLATPVYNYDAGSAAKNLIELTGQAWSGKIVGFLCAAGGRGSYMAVMGLAGSLMLDFQSLIIPHFVYATPGVFDDQDRLVDDKVRQRIEQLVSQVTRLATALAPGPGAATAPPPSAG